ncbi:pre-mRNA-processing factor 19 [Anaeramoeba flamelloides]|uniref:Pre-mRNA-processing factor 19 n=1 Tax=Anaeramoeba flamelloides TaxID=1746091 RepID=A0ABQ8YN37_9EUKA|nr:pre-mRNA-processing factor 19 [Anaeramoeba flamelloides]
MKNREELAKTLYEYDAACRVIARLITERDEAREALSKYQLPEKPLQMQNKKKSTQQEIQKSIEKQMEIELQKNEQSKQIPKERIENIVTLSKRYFFIFLSNKPLNISNVLKLENSSNKQK